MGWAVRHAPHAPHVDRVHKHGRSGVGGLEESLRTDLSMEGLVDVGQENGRLEQLANVPLLNPYYSTVYNQGLTEYPDKHVIQDDTQLPDNNRALRQLATDAKHYKMVRSQYDNEQ